MDLERIELTIAQPKVQVEGLAFEYTCGQSTRWVMHKSIISRLDGPWHYCASAYNVSSLPFATLREAQSEAVLQVERAERGRLIRWHAEQAIKELG